jgi:hypothetical protein
MTYRTKRNRVADRLRLYVMREETMSKASHVRRLTTVAQASVPVSIEGSIWFQAIERGSAGNKKRNMI